MAPESTSPQTSVTPAKLGLIAVLSAVLLAVVGYQWAARRSPSPEIRDTLERLRAGKEQASVGRPAAASPRPAAGALVPRIRLKRGEEVALSEALLWDPFALPAALRGTDGKERAGDSAPRSTADPREENRWQELQRRREATLAALREKGVGMILATRGTSVATVGSDRKSVV